MNFFVFAGQTYAYSEKIRCSKYGLEKAESIE